MSALYRLLTITCFTILLGCNNDPAAILLFNGTGTSPNDVAAVETILDNNNLKYQTVNSSSLNAMSREQLNSYRLLIVPGGDFMVMGNSLTKATAANIRHAVQHGLNYLGICAGGFLAGNSKYYNGFNLASGATFRFYSAANKGVSKAAVAITNPDGTALDQYWEDGPQLSGWGEAVAKYPDGTPAVAEGKCGKGFIILTGIHAEAPADWRRGMVFNTSVSADNGYAEMLIRAGFNGNALPHY
ncbi:MAG: BPL-N domain-containing protein [Bacteroidota bacterium]